jgi:DNA (cytosine-5)-methyltransferase 1
MAHKGNEWGQYEAAVRRWEQTIGRDAPKPTEATGRDGQQQLSAKFTEWMMGLEEGWVTSPEIGLTRNEALKACGNGVVPQQAALALNILLDGVDW